MSDQYELPEEAIPTEIEENGGHLYTRPDFEIAGNQTLKFGSKTKSNFYQTDKLKVSKNKTDQKPRTRRMSKDNSLGAGIRKRATERSQ